jgi:hypothetical protein
VPSTDSPLLPAVTSASGGTFVASTAMKFTLSRVSLLDPIVDELGTTILVRTKRDLPNFTFTFDEVFDGAAFLAALSLVDVPASRATKAPLPGMLERGDVDYRSAPAQADELRRVLEDGEAALSVRAAAAIALDLDGLDRTV